MYLTGAAGALISRPRPVSAPPGQFAQFSCSTSGKDPVNWEFRAKEAQNFERIFYGGILNYAYLGRFNVSRETVFTLTVVNVSPSDEGSFRCVDNGGQGPDKGQADLDLNGK